VLQTSIRLLLPLLLAGCALLSPRLGATPEAIVAGFESTFPILRELQVEVYFKNQACEYFSDRLGHFSSTPQDESCQVFSDARHPDGNPPRPDPFDDEAGRDLAALKSAFAAASVPLDFLNLSFTIGLSAPGNAFGYNGCYSFFYRTPPSEDAGTDSVDTQIDEDWSMTNFCP
jgi:hypothetical protein